MIMRFLILFHYFTAVPWTSSMTHKLHHHQYLPLHQGQQNQPHQVLVPVSDKVMYPLQIYPNPNYLARRSIRWTLTKKHFGIQILRLKEILQIGDKK